MNHFIERLAIDYPFTYQTIEEVFNAVGKKEQRTIEVLEQAKRLNIQPGDINGLFTGIGVKHKY